MIIKDNYTASLREWIRESDSIADGIEDESDHTLDAIQYLMGISNTDPFDDTSTYCTSLNTFNDRFANIPLFANNNPNRHFNMVLSATLLGCLDSRVGDYRLFNHRYRFIEIPNVDPVKTHNGTRVLYRAFDHPTRQNDSYAFLDLREVSNCTDLAPLFADQHIDPDSKITAVLATMLADSDQLLSNKCWCISRGKNEPRHENLIRYFLALEGCILVEPVASPTFIQHRDVTEKLCIDLPLEQYGEVALMLAEINNRTTLIDKFLSAYHVLENYMLRAKLAHLVNKQTINSPFTIRNFKQLDLAIDKNEFKNLKALFQASLTHKINGKSLETYFKQFHSQLTDDGFDESEFKGLLEKLGVNIGQNTDVTEFSKICENIPNLIYKVRCSIVHNKETEFHLSNKELNQPGYANVLSQLCIPIMLLLAFGLPLVDDDSPISYLQKEIVLY